jgi:hypothetical protein
MTIGKTLNAALLMMAIMAFIATAITHHNLDWRTALIFFFSFALRAINNLLDSQ